jgi:hypothetical protein
MMILTSLIMGNALHYTDLRGLKKYLKMIVERHDINDLIASLIQCLRGLSAQNIENHYLSILTAIMQLYQ